MIHRPKRVRRPGTDYQVRILGDHPRPLLDFYHWMMRLSWTQTLLSIAAAFVLANTVFALGFVATGGIAHSDGTFADAFFFSVQTMGTIGYGAMYPETRAANLMVAAESVIGLTLTALATGLVFAKFSRPTARVVFTKQAVIAPVNGVPTLMFRLGNERGNHIVDAKIHVILLRTEQLAEGGTFYRMLDLKLARHRSLSLSRSWSVQHSIDASSPLHGMSPELLEAQEAEVQILLVGLDDTSMQTIHASHRYFAEDIVWGARHADILSESESGDMTLDLRKFHDTVPSNPTAGFPYPA